MEPAIAATNIDNLELSLYIMVCALMKKRSFFNKASFLIHILCLTKPHRGVIFMNNGITLRYNML